MLNNAELQTVLTEIVDPYIADLTNKAPVLYNLLEDGEEERVNSKGVRLTAKVRGNPSMNWFSEGGIYPEGGNTKRINMYVNYSRFAIATRLTRDVLEQSTSQTIVNILTDSVKDDTASALKEFNQQSYGDGIGTKMTVLSVAGSTITAKGVYGSTQLIVTGKYSIYAGSARAGVIVGQKLGDVELTALPSKTTATFASLAVPATLTHALVDGDVLTYKNSYGLSIHGLDYHISSGTGDYQGSSRDTYSELRAYEFDAAGNALTVAMLNRLIFQAKYLRGNNKVDDSYIIISSPAQAHRYIGMADVSASGANRTTITAMPDGKKLDLGYTTYSFAGLRWIEDTDAPDNKLYVIKRSLLKRYVFKKLGLVELTGSANGIAPIPSFDSDGVGSYRDAGMYVMTAKFDFGSPDPAMLGMKITNLSTTGVATATSNFSFTA